MNMNTNMDTELLIQKDPYTYVMNRKPLTCRLYFILYFSWIHYFPGPERKQALQNTLKSNTCGISSVVPESKIQEQNYFIKCHYTTVTNWFYIPSEQTVDIRLESHTGIQLSLGCPCEVRILVLIQSQLVANVSFWRYSVIQRQVPGCKSSWHLLFKKSTG